MVLAGNAAKITLLVSASGAIAQLGERVVRNDEAVGSIPTSSTIFSITYSHPAVPSCPKLVQNNFQRMGVGTCLNKLRRTTTSGILLDSWKRQPAKRRGFFTGAQMEQLSTVARRVAHLAGAFFSSIKPIRIRDFFAVMQKKLSTRFVRFSTGSCVASRRSPYANSQSSSTKRNCMESAKSSSTLPTNKCGTPPTEPALKMPETHARASSVSSVARSGVCYRRH